MAIHDKELTFLAKRTNEQLDPLLDALLDKDHKGRISSELELEEVFKANYPNHRAYVWNMIHELQKYGGNTIANLFRGGEGVCYREILMDVCDALKVNYNKRQSTDLIEEGLLAKVLEKVVEKMTPEERAVACKEAGCDIHDVGGLAASALVALFRAGGFASYKITLIIVNYIWKLIFAKGLSLAANKAIAQFLSVLTGPIGIAAASIWTVIDIASPAMRVTVPATIYIAALRRIAAQEEVAKAAA